VTFLGALVSHLRLLRRFGREKGEAHPMVPAPAPELSRVAG
jgi:hypothetical protein